MQEEVKNDDSSSAIKQMRSIFDDGKKLSRKIYEVAGVIVKPNDSLPDKVCAECIKKINSAIQFQKTCRASNIYLQNVLQRAKSTSSLFKQDIPTCEISEDDIVENETVVPKIEVYDPKIANLKRIRIHHLYKAPLGDRTENSSYDDLEHGISIMQQEVVSDNIEVEESIEQFEDITEQIFCYNDNGSEEVNINMKAINQNENVCNKNGKNIKIKSSEIDNFYEKDSLNKNTEVEFHEQNDDVLNAMNNDENKIQNSTKNHDNMDEGKLDQQVANEIMEYFSIDKEEVVVEEEGEIIEDYGENIDKDFMLYSDHELDENQAQVSSTVDTNDEIEFDEQNSAASNMSEVNEEYIVDTNLDTYNPHSKQTNKETPATKSYTYKAKTVIENPSRSSKERNSPIIFPRRKLRRKIKSNTETAGFVCVCEICGNQFTNRNVMNIHMKVHYQEKNHQCEICFKRFITACNLQAHMRIHTGEKPFECKYCGRRFNDRTSNLRHERTHTNERPFKCDDCSKTFSLATTLQNHMKVHTNERSYRCEPCGKSFKLVHHLKTHQNTYLHRSVLGEGVPEN